MIAAVFFDRCLSCIFNLTCDRICILSFVYKQHCHFSGTAFCHSVQCTFFTVCVFQCWSCLIFRYCAFFVDICTIPGLITGSVINHNAIIRCHCCIQFCESFVVFPFTRIIHAVCINTAVSINNFSGIYIFVFITFVIVAWNLCRIRFETINRSCLYLSGIRCRNGIRLPVTEIALPVSIFFVLLSGAIVIKCTGRLSISTLSIGCIAEFKIPPAVFPVNFSLSGIYTYISWSILRSTAGSPFFHPVHGTAAVRAASGIWILCSAGTASECIITISRCCSNLRQIICSWCISRIFRPSTPVCVSSGICCRYQCKPCRCCRCAGRTDLSFIFITVFCSWFCDQVTVRWECSTPVWPFIAHIDRTHNRFCFWCSGCLIIYNANHRNLYGRNESGI